MLPKPENVPQNSPVEGWARIFKGRSVVPKSAELRKTHNIQFHLRWAAISLENAKEEGKV